MNNRLNFKNWDEDYFNHDYKRHIGGRELKVIEASKKRGDRIINLIKNSKIWITLKFVNQDDNIINESNKYLQYSMQAMYGLIKALEKENQKVTFWLVDEEISVQVGEKARENVSRLKHFLNMAYISRCEPVIEAIFNQANKPSFFSNELMITHFTYPLYFLERSYKSISEEKVKELLDEINSFAADEYKNDKEFGGWYTECLVPLNKLRKIFFLGDEEEFNTQLKITLDKNRAYQDSEEFDRVREKDEWLPWDIIAYACRAYDKGWEITVEDSRLPMFLVEGKCNVTTLAPE